jgi:NAD dependent epimerase/dehydratase family enzyme
MLSNAKDLRFAPSATTPGAPWPTHASVRRGGKSPKAIPLSPRKIVVTTAVEGPASDKGCVFEVLSNLVRRGLGGTQGLGAQYVSWIHETDFVRAIDFLIANGTMAGAINICSPNPLPNRDFMRALRQVWSHPFGLPAAAWMIEIGSFLLRTESELVLKSRRVIPGRLLEAGLTFTYPEWPAAAEELVDRWSLSRGVRLK